MPCATSANPLNQHIHAPPVSPGCGDVYLIRALLESDIRRAQQLAMIAPRHQNTRHGNSIFIKDWNAAQKVDGEIHIQIATEPFLRG